MLPTEDRIKELRERFGVWNGQFWAYYKYKNLNWYLIDLSKDSTDEAIADGEWFNFGDIREEDVDRVAKLLKPGEALVLGWKDLGPNVRQTQFFGTGGDIWLLITTGGARYDVTKHGRVLIRKGTV